MTRRSRQSRTGSSEDGFTLLEVLVALAILSMSLATLLGVFGQSLDRDRSIRQHMAARTLAQSLLIQAETDPNLKIGSRTGSDAPDMNWTVTAAQVSSEEVTPSLAQISVAVHWTNDGSTETVHLTTLRVLAGEPAL